MNPLLSPTETSSDRLPLPSEATVSTSANVRRVPLTIPRDQEYYWHFEWQEGEREAVAEITAGQTVRFDSDDPEDAARWLDEPEE